MKQIKAASKTVSHDVPSEVLWRFIRQGLSVRLIAEELQQLGFTVSKSTVQNRIAKLKRESCIMKEFLSKRRKILDERDKRMMEHWIRVDGIRSKMQILKRLRAIGRAVSYRTVDRTLRSMASIRFGYPSRKVYMTADHRMLRLAWAREQLASPHLWSKVFFTDEKQWKLDGPVRRSKVLYDVRDPRPVVSQRGQRNDSVQVWGAISLTSVPPLAPISRHFNSKEYIKVLTARFLPTCQTPVPVLLHDRHPAHHSKKTMKWLNTLRLKVILLPAKSPDLNLIENVWSVVSREVYSGTKTYDTKESLLNAIRAAWERVRVNHTLRQNLVDSMTRRLKAVVLAKGGPTKF